MPPFPISTPSRRFRNCRALIVAAVLAGLPMGEARAHIVREEPWHPIAAAYLRSLFHANLKPIAWDHVAAEWQDAPAAGTAALERLRGPWPGDGSGEVVSGIVAALEARDRGLLYARSTEAVSRLIRGHLERAAALLDEPGAALADVLEAQRLYRAFAQDYLAGFDREGYDRLGRLWLRMSSSAGTAGVAGIGARPADRETFEAARREMADYLRTNYESGEFAPDGRLVPMPALAGERIRARQGRFGSLASVLGPDRLAVLPPGSNLNDQDPLPRLRLNIEARGVDEKDTFMIAYGDMLFDSPLLFGEPARSLGIACSTCHNRSDINREFFIPGVSARPGTVDVDSEYFNPRFNDHRRDPLDIPSLRGIRFTAPYGRDGRTASLRDFTRTAILHEFGGEEPTSLMLEALTAYLLEFDWLPNPMLAADGTLTDEAPAEAQRGEEIFHRPMPGMGDRSCATCHVPSNNFLDGRRHDIGSQEPTEPGARDAQYDTPTLLNATYTAPYFHDGSLETLADVVEWFDRRHQLGLSAAERTDLTAYLEVVGSGVDPWEEFDDENTPFALAWDELSTFLSTLETLIPARDSVHALLLLDTVASDLELDASAAVDRTVVPAVREIVEELRGVRADIAAGDWASAAAGYDRYVELAVEHGPSFR